MTRELGFWNEKKVLMPLGLAFAWYEIQRLFIFGGRTLTGNATFCLI